MIDEFEQGSHMDRQKCCIRANSLEKINNKIGRKVLESLLFLSHTNYSCRLLVFTGQCVTPQLPKQKQYSITYVLQAVHILYPKE